MPALLKGWNPYVKLISAH